MYYLELDYKNAGLRTASLHAVRVLGLCFFSCRFFVSNRLIQTREFIRSLQEKEGKLDLVRGEYKELEARN